MQILSKALPDSSARRFRQLSVSLFNQNISGLAKVLLGVWKIQVNMRVRFLGALRTNDYVKGCSKSEVC